MEENQMGLWACMAYVVGNVVGSGIFITPTDVLEHSGSIGLALIMWLVCGLISLLGGIAFIELGTGIPSDGGDFAYQTFVGWNAIAFSFMAVGALLTFPASTAIQSTTFGDYMVKGLEQFFVFDATYSVFLSKFFCLILLAGCTFLNAFSVGRIASVFQMIATAAKGLILAVVVAVGAYWVTFQESKIAISDVFTGSDFSPSNLVLAAYMGLWSFAGWDILNYGAPAVKNPRRTLPLSLIGGLILVTVLYVATNLAFCAVLGKEQMLASKAVAADFANVSMGPFAILIPFATAILLIGSVNANIFCTARIILEGAKKGHLCSFLAAENKEHSSPRAALIFQFIISVIFTFFDVETVIYYVSFVIFAQKAVTMAAFFVIRRRGMEMDKGVLRVPIWISAVFFVLCLILVVVPIYTQFRMTMWGAAGVFCSIIFYYLFVQKEFRIWGYETIKKYILLALKNFFDAELIEDKNGEYAPDVNVECEEDDGSDVENGSPEASSKKVLMETDL